MKYTKGKYVLDKLDESILRILTDNARASKQEISKAVGLGRQAVATRMRMMKEAGIIEEYTVVVNWDLIEEGE